MACLTKFLGTCNRLCPENETVVMALMESSQVKEIEGEYDLDEYWVRVNGAGQYQIAFIHERKCIPPRSASEGVEAAPTV